MPPQNIQFQQRLLDTFLACIQQPKEGIYNHQQPTVKERPSAKSRVQKVHFNIKLLCETKGDYKKCQTEIYANTS